jgi:hypothetical protein
MGCEVIGFHSSGVIFDSEIASYAFTATTSRKTFMANKNRIGLDRALATAGGPSALAKLIGIAPQAISQWKEVPLRRILDVEKATGVPREILRPDMYQRTTR